MNNYRNNRKNRFKPSSDRNYRKRPINGIKNQSDFNTNSDFRHRSPGRNNHNAAKLVEKYSNLAREALSSGDKILSENYFQHADHFKRIMNENELVKKIKQEKNSENTELKLGSFDVENKVTETPQDAGSSEQKSQIKEN